MDRKKLITYIIGITVIILILISIFINKNFNKDSSDNNLKIEAYIDKHYAIVNSTKDVLFEKLDSTEAILNNTYIIWLYNLKQGKDYKLKNLNSNELIRLANSYLGNSGVMDVCYKKSYLDEVINSLFSKKISNLKNDSVVNKVEDYYCIKNEKLNSNFDINLYNLEEQKNKLILTYTLTSNGHSTKYSVEYLKDNKLYKFNAFYKIN